MPLLHLTLTADAFDTDARNAIVRLVTDAACKAESIPDEPGPRSRCIVLVDELAAQHAYSAGSPADGAIRGAFATYYAPAGVLDAARKATFATELQAAAEKTARGTGLVVTSAVIVEVPEGQWAQQGKIMRLPEIAGIAQFGHLAAIATRR